jgi:HlyD family secretion protein
MGFSLFTSHIASSTVSASLFPINNLKEFMEFPLTDTIYDVPYRSPAAGYMYTGILAAFMAAICAMPFIYTDISVKAPGITRPMNERTELKVPVVGIIDSVYVRDGQPVTKGQYILGIRNDAARNKRLLTDSTIQQTARFIHDLTLLTATELNAAALPGLHSALYTEQLQHFLEQEAELQVPLQKAEKEMDIGNRLLNEKVISQKEFFDAGNNRRRVIAAISVLKRAQLSSWQEDLARYRNELLQLHGQMHEIEAGNEYYLIRAPVSGTIQGLTGRYSGGQVQAGEPLCYISPEGSIVGECMVSSRDIGLLRIGQPARFQVAAFDYHYFGTLTGRIVGIDNDYTSISNQAFFRLRCSFDSTQLHLKNGFTGRLQKGLEFQAGFIIGKRSIWQLLFDRADDWFKPGTSSNYLLP